MKWKNLVKAAFLSITRNKMRSALTMLGVIIGVASVIALVALGEGSQAGIEKEITSLGTNLLIIHPGSQEAGGVRGGAGSRDALSMDDVQYLRKNARLLQAVSPVITVQEQVIASGENWNTSVTGVSPEYLSIRNYQLSSGSFFTEREIKARTKVAVLGKTVADELFPGQDPIGVQIRIRNVPFKVIGVLAGKGQSSMGPDQDDIILAPSTTVLYRLGNGRTVRTIMVSALSSDMMDSAKEETAALLRESHRLHPGEKDDFNVRDQAEIIQMATSIFGMLTLLLSSIAGVSLLVGGIGIMNIMLVSVTERTREIGIRMAVGARSADVLVQFLVEAVILSLMGGAVGILAGIGIGSLLGSFVGTDIIVDPSIIFVSVIFTGAVGVFFGFYPARKAAKLNPIDALRYE